MRTAREKICLVFCAVFQSRDAWMPVLPERRQDVIYLDPSDPTYTFAYKLQ